MHARTPLHPLEKEKGTKKMEKERKQKKQSSTLSAAALQPSKKDSLR